VGLEIKMCEIFGLNGAAGGYFLKACDEIQSGNYNAAEILITRGIYICTGSSQPAQRTLAAMAQVFGKLGEKDMAREHEARVRTFDKIAERMARTQEEKAILEDQRRELQISIDLQANKWRAPGSRTLFEQVVRNRGTQNGNGKKEHSDALFSLSNARLLLAEDLLDELPGLLSDLLTVISNAPQNQQPGLYLSTYCLARACNDVSAMHDSASELSKIGIHPEYLFSCPSFTNSTPLYVGSPDLQMSNMVDPSQKVAQILAILSVADTRCYAAVALSVRISGQTRGLFELLRHSACLGLPISTIDTLLCELVQLPDLTSADLRQISDEVLFSGQNLRIPSGLGWYYYPGIMLTSAWVGGVLFAVSFSAARKWDILLPLTGIFMVAGTIGAFADLFLWKVIKLWERPEKSRRYIAELGTIVVFWAAAYLINPHLPQSLKQSGLVAVGFFVGIATLFSVDFVARHRLFNRWLAKDIASGSAVTCLLGILGWWLGKTWLGSEMAQHVLIGLYFTGSLAISFALNIFPKHLSCTKYFDQQEKFSQKDFQ